MSSTYPIRAVSRLTNISEETLRAWERRYRAVTPKRVGRARMYSDKEIQRLVLLQQAVAEGHSIGRIAAESDAQLRKLVGKSASLARGGEGAEVPARIATAAGQEGLLLAPLLAAVEAYDYARADSELSRLSAAIASPRELVHRLALPLMNITGERWHKGTFTIAQEHIVTGLLSGLFAALLRLYGQNKPRARIVMATPENEHHGFGILAAAMLTAAGGLGAIHLGTNLPAGEIAKAARKTKAEAILIGLSATTPAAGISALQEIQNKAFLRTKLWVGGASAAMAAALRGSGWTVLEDFQTLERQLALLGANF